jgi:hypothetical protein
MGIVYFDCLYIEKIEEELKKETPESLHMMLGEKQAN